MLVSLALLGLAAAAPLPQARLDRHLAARSVPPASPLPSAFAPGSVFAPQAIAPHAPARPAQAIGRPDAAQGGGGDGFGTSFSTLGDARNDGGADFAIGVPWLLNGSGTSGSVYVYNGIAGGFFVGPQVLDSPQLGNAFGYSVAGVGDVNGDGRGDLLVGAPYHQSGGHAYCGKAFLYLGTPTGYQSLSSWQFETLEDGAEVGWQVAGAGDVNKDGYDDWLVGAPYHGNGETNEGAAYLFYGSAGALSATPAWTQESNRMNAFFGYALAGAGDVNADGYGDIVIGAPGDENPATKSPAEGAVWLFAGAGGLPSHVPARKFYGQQFEAALGASVAPAGDVDGDGYADFLAGAPYFSNDQSVEGIVRMYFGAGALPLVGSLPALIESTIPNAGFGSSVGSAGDVNGDGYPDFMVGSNSVPQVDGAGAAYLYLGTNSRSWGAAFDEFAADTPSQTMGVSVGQLGDVDGDGHSEYAAGAPSATAAGNVFFRPGTPVLNRFVDQIGAQGYAPNALIGTAGATLDMDGDGFDDLVVGSPQGEDDGQNRGLIALYRGGPHAFTPVGGPPYLGAAADWTYHGAKPFELAGWALANAGDVNGDGYEDLVAGGYAYSQSEALEGTAMLFSGSPGGFSGTPAWRVEGNEANAYMGYAVTGGGDLDGDGFDDVAVGLPLAASGGSARGEVRVYRGSALGLSTSPWVVLPGLLDDADFGVGVTIVGDVNRDGYDDLVVGAPFHSDGEADEGRLFLYLGSPTGVHAPASQEIQIDVAGAGFGYLAARIGDVNGDGYADVAVGAPNYANGQVNEGLVSVFYGSPAGLVTPAGWTLEGDQPDLRLGQYGLGGAGDFDGDGYDDFILGEPNLDAGGQDVGAVLVYPGGPAGLGLTTLLSIDSGLPFIYLGAGGGGMADFNGDGASDLWYSAPGYSLLWASVGVVGVRYGNLWAPNTRNPDRPGAAWRTDGSAPIGFGLRSNATNAFALHGRARSPAGRGRVRLEWEVKPQATAFNSAGRGVGPWQSTAAVVPGEGSSAALSATVGGLATGTRYHWRARYRTSSPLFPWTPWFGVERGSDNDRMLVTSGVPGVVAVDPPAPVALALAGAAPNPFVRATTLAFTLPRAGTATLTLFGVDGRRVRTLHAGLAPAGTSTLAWDGTDERGRAVPAGAYFTRLTFDGETRVGKIVRLR
jgi:hypothetical protein